MADTNSASLFGSGNIELRKELLSKSASIELKKELLSKTIPQNTKICTKFAFNVFDGTSISKSHSNFTGQPFY